MGDALSDFGPRLRAAREKAGLTQEGLAEALDVARFTVIRWETGKLYPAFERLDPIAAAVKRPLSWFFRNGDGEEASVESHGETSDEVLASLVAQHVVRQLEPLRQEVRELRQEVAELRKPPPPDRVQEPPTDLDAYRARRVDEVAREITEGRHAAAGAEPGASPEEVAAALEEMARRGAEMVVDYELKEQQ